MEWTNEVIFEFLRLYKNEPDLWNTNSAGHKNRNDMYDAWTRIKNQLRNGTITIKEIKKKRDNLMSTYRKLHSKLQDSLKSGCDPDQVYKTDWPFYNMMYQFLGDIYIPKIKRNNSEALEDKYDTDSERPLQSQKKMKRSKKNKNESRLDEPTVHFREKTHELEQDECSLYTELLCKKLRGLPEKARDIAMLEIDRLIFNLKQNQTQPRGNITPVPIYHLQPLSYQRSYEFQTMQHFHPSPINKPHNSSPSPEPLSKYRSTLSPKPSPKHPSTP